ncbi:MAG: putative DNA binding domain-containing protein [Bryobacterales bacterium]|nr:putative DNA binding domain-containing protein [Bryobacterales bacterium]
MLGSIRVADAEARSRDLLSRMHENFLPQFASAVVTKAREFYTPRCVVGLLVIIAFANADGGRLLMGATDDGLLQGMSREQMAALDNLLVAVGMDAIKPALRIGVHHRELDGKAFVLVEVPRGDSLHERGGRSWVRVGASKRRLTSDEPMRLAQQRAQGRHLWFDEQPVAGTGFDTLEPALWRPILSAEGATEPELALAKLALLASDESGV